MAAASEFPTELATRPLGLTALMGLDINQKPLHKAIWESFSVNRHPERVPLSFRLLPIVHFTVVCLVAKPLNRSETKGDLVMIQTLLYYVKFFLFWLHLSSFSIVYLVYFSQYIS